MHYLGVNNASPANLHIQKRRERGEAPASPPEDLTLPHSLVVKVNRVKEGVWYLPNNLCFFSPLPAPLYRLLLFPPPLKSAMWQHLLLPLLVALANQGHDQRLVPLVTAFGASMDQQEADRSKKRKQLYEDFVHDDYYDLGPPSPKRRNTKKKSYTFPTQANRPRSVHDVFRKLGEVHFRCYFRLGKDEIIPFMRHMGIQPGDKVRCPTTRYVEDAGLAFLMLLFRLTAPRPLRPDAELFFGQDKGRISRWAESTTIRGTGERGQDGGGVGRSMG